MAQTEETKIALFPPLPPVPEPLRFPPDERQQAFRRIAGRIADAAGPEVGLSAANTSSGFPASAVDLGRVRAALESGIMAFDMDRVRERWEADICRWMTRTILSWVQRCKVINFHLNEKGLRIELETQDDLGYYSYVFAVFPGKE